MEELRNQTLGLLHGYVPLQRIERYLQEAEMDDWFTTLKRKEVEGPLNREDDSRVWVKSGTFVWHAGMAQHQPETLESRTEPHPGSQKDIFSLSDISLDFPNFLSLQAVLVPENLVYFLHSSEKWIVHPVHCISRKRT